MTIKTNLDDIQKRIAAAAQQAGRIAADITLIAVSKTFDANTVEEAINAGQYVFGENRVQEAENKFPAIKEKYPGLQLHLIGPLQTNKVKDALRLFDVIETVDRERIAARIAEELKANPRPNFECFIQVNTGEEEQKSGIMPGQADEFIKLCIQGYNLPVTGLMCIPPLNENPALHFALLHDIAKRNSLEKISMGMSADFETAIRYGATHVRIGSAVFGNR